MRNFLTTLLLISFALTTQTAFADGLLYQLPEDGAFVVYDLEIEVREGFGKIKGKGKLKNIRNHIGKGTLKIASVGSVTENGEKCRWIELKMILEMQGQKSVTISKILVPEKYLKEGENAFGKKIRGWVQPKSSDVKVMDKEFSGLVTLILCGPLNEEKKLKSKTVDSKLGKLKCERVSGYKKFKVQGVEWKARLITSRHKKVPFGVVSSDIVMETEETAQIGVDLKWTLTLKEIGKNAKSELPDAK